ncbi:serine/threonine protein phosphatase [Orenia metallireducens]|jgi:protein phosphatase|uniref:Serine/threonine protein phosphatase n=1 Tax=Orenia metallireducens TaxID=1413210 RepID=A0A1C0AC43_9FIRM|nr:Stp1/IreP family PP2C-type Ser/Thr phosphatase [Orenia metallireducens]OCL27930.1 serine/threonine protein phosphatase [Orenia metallireducens]
MKYGATSEVGKVRRENQDNYLVINKDSLDIIVVADGMGGHQGGNVASSLAIKGIKEYDFNHDSLKDSIKECIELVNQRIQQEGLAKEEYQGMGTTLTMGVIKDRILIIGHIGDSRAYLFRDGKLQQLTNDHSYVGELLRNNIISQKEADNHPKKNLLLNALGVKEEIEADLFELDLESNDLILLCSDGLTNMLSDDKISEVLSENLDLQKKADKMALLANQQGGYDNITVVIYCNH